MNERVWQDKIPGDLAPLTSLPVLETQLIELSHLHWVPKAGGSLPSPESLDFGSGGCREGGYVPDCL